MMNVSDIERKARRILKDEFEEYRWSSDEIKDDIQDGIYALHSIRPETRYVDGQLQNAVKIGEDGEIAIDQRFEEALVCYVVYRCYQNDDTDTTNVNLAESYLAKFNTKAQL